MVKRLKLNSSQKYTKARPTMETNKSIYIGMSPKSRPHKYLPTVNLHSTGLLQLCVHLKHGVQHVWLVAPSLLQANSLRSFKVVHQLRLIIRVCALLDDDARPFTGRQATNIGKTLVIFIYQYEGAAREKQGGEGDKPAQ